MRFVFWGPMQAHLELRLQRRTQAPLTDKRMDFVKQFVAAARSAGWSAEIDSSGAAELPKSLTSRYSGIPSDYATFLRYCTKAINAERNLWFNCRSEFDREHPELAFPWNAVEQMSLEWADDDMEWSQRIQAFWDRRIPVALSVEGDYEFIAIDLRDSSIVHGVAPDFEEVSVVASSFTEYLSGVTKRMNQGAISVLL